MVPPSHSPVILMRIITAEYFEYRNLADRYDFPFHEIDPRASSYDGDFYQELVRRGDSENGFTDALMRLSYGLPDDRVPELPTRQDVLDLMAEEARERTEGGQHLAVPDDLAPLIADMRVFSNHVMSPEVAEHCRSKRDAYIAMADTYRGRWLWHMLEEVPLLSDDAVELSLRIISTFDVERRGGDVVLRNLTSEITFRDATVTGTLRGVFRALFAEVYLEEGMWIVCTTSGPGTDLDIRAPSFEIRSMRRGRW